MNNSMIIVVVKKAVLRNEYGSEYGEEYIITLPKGADSIRARCAVIESIVSEEYYYSSRDVFQQVHFREEYVTPPLPIHTGVEPKFNSHYGVLMYYYEE